MDDYTQSKTSSSGGFGFLVAAVIVVLVLLYALFAGGSAGTTIDPATIGTTDEGVEASPVAELISRVT